MLWRRDLEEGAQCFSGGIRRVCANRATTGFSALDRCESPALHVVTERVTVPELHTEAVHIFCGKTSVFHYDFLNSENVFYDDIQF